MKIVYRLLALLIVIQFASCKDDTGEKESSLHIKMLTANTWAHARVTHDAGDLSDQYTDFAMVFTGNTSGGFDGSYVISHGGYAFSETSGLWKFNDDFTQIIFDSGKEMEVTVSKERLQLEFTVAAASGKLYGVSGNFLFELQPL